MLHQVVTLEPESFTDVWHVTCVLFSLRGSWLPKVIVIHTYISYLTSYTIIGSTISIYIYIYTDYHSSCVKMNRVEHSMNRRCKGRKFPVASCKVLLFCCTGSSSEWDHHLRTWGRTMKLVWDPISVLETKGFNPTYPDIFGPLRSQTRFTKFNIT